MEQGVENGSALAAQSRPTATRRSQSLAARTPGPEGKAHWSWPTLLGLLTVDGGGETDSRPLVAFDLGDHSP